MSRVAEAKSSLVDLSRTAYFTTTVVEASGPVNGRTSDDWPEITRKRVGFRVRVFGLLAFGVRASIYRLNEELDIL